MGVGGVRCFLTAPCPVGVTVNETQRFEGDPAVQTQLSSCCRPCFTQDGDKCLGCPSACHSGL